MEYIERESRPEEDESLLSDKSNGKMDYFADSLISRKNPGKFFLVMPTKQGFPAIAFNPRDFGNFLWGAGAKALGFSTSTMFFGAWANNLFNQNKNNPGQKGWGFFDDPADSRANHAGWYYPYPTPIICGAEYYK